MVPIRDNNPTKITPYVTYGLIAANVLAFIYEASLPPQYLDGFFHLFAVVPREFWDGMVERFELDEYPRFQPVW